MKKLFIFLITISISLSAQSKDPQKILEKLKNQFNTIKDYTVDAKIKVDIDFIKVPDMAAKIYFKQPDKMKMDSEAFAMLPKQAFNFSPNKLLSFEHTAVYSGNEKINGKNVDVIRVIPKSDSAEIILSTLWIDNENGYLRKVESTSRQGGTFKIELAYNNNLKYPLPKSIKLLFDMPKMNFPRQPSQNSENKNDKQPDKPRQGAVVIEYSGYKVNQGLSDNIFVERKK